MIGKLKLFIYKRIYLSSEIHTLSNIRAKIITKKTKLISSIISINMRLMIFYLKKKTRKHTIRLKTYYCYTSSTEIWRNLFALCIIFMAMLLLISNLYTYLRFWHFKVCDEHYNKIILLWRFSLIIQLKIK